MGDGAAGGGDADAGPSDAPDASDVPGDGPADGADAGPDGVADAAPDAADVAPDAGDAAGLVCRWVGDFDGDGLTDCAAHVTHGDAHGDVAFHKGLAGGGYAAQAVVTAAIVAPSGRDFAIFDLNHDGRQDIVTAPVTADPGFTNVKNYVQIFRGQADGTFVPFAATPPAEGLPIDRFPDSLNGGPRLDYGGLRRDYDGDGFSDLLAQRSYNGGAAIDWLVVKSSGGLDFKVAISEAPPVKGLLTAKIAADLGNDGRVDLISITTYLSASPQAIPDGVYLSYGVGDGRFGPGLMVAGTDDATDVVLGDLDADSKPDLLVTFAAGSKIFYGDGAGNFAARP
jgi:hypothetical protein